jgi:hemolysin III
MTGYEVFHAVEHFPYEWWKSATEHPYMGLLFRKLYGFHHFHHANIKSNEAISGFYGLPIADWVFRTYHQPKELLLEGRVATAKEFQMKPPIRIVRWLDNLAREQEAKIIRKVA